jgi:uroporphyrinogen-III synthase
VQPATIHILCTRPLGTNLLEEGAAKGIAICVIPFIGTVPVTPEELNSRLQDLISPSQTQTRSSQDADIRRLIAVFTSVTAVEAVGRWWKGMTANPTTLAGSSNQVSTQDAQHLPTWEIFCTSCATRDAAANIFGNNAIAGTADSARQLAEVIIQKVGPGSGRGQGSVPDRKIYFFCGDLRREELPALLTDNGFRVDEQIVYRTILTPQPAPDKYDGIVFFSPSAVESFFSVNTVTPDTRMFAIGATTANAIRTRCDNRVIISHRPEKSTMIRQMIDYFQTNNICY